MFPKGLPLPTSTASLSPEGQKENVNPGHHPNLNARQKLNEEGPLETHGGPKAKNMLEQDNSQINMAASAANDDAG